VFDTNVWIGDHRVVEDWWQAAQAAADPGVCMLMPLVRS
jgi:hypothetical protein